MACLTEELYSRCYKEKRYGPIGYHGDQAHCSTKVVDNGATLEDNLADFGSRCSQFWTGLSRVSVQLILDFTNWIGGSQSQFSVLSS